MAAEPSKRFQNVEEMRPALEQIGICMNWNEQTLSNGTRWTSIWDNKCFDVVNTFTSNGKWSIVTKRGSSKQTLRRVMALCYKDLSKTDAIKNTKGILQNYVLGRVHLIRSDNKILELTHISSADEPFVW